MYYYAELNENDICVAVYESLDPIDASVFSSL